MRKLSLCLAMASLCAALGAAPAAAQVDDETYQYSVPPDMAAIKAQKCEFTKLAPGKSDIYKHRTIRVAGRAGEAIMSVVEKAMRCKAHVNNWVLLGMRGAAGKMAVPYAYRNIHPVSPDAAIVQRLDRSWTLFADGKEVALPFAPDRVQPSDGRGPCTELSLSPDGTQGVFVLGEVRDGRRDVAYFHGSASPTLFRGVRDGDAVRRMGDRIYVNFDGSARVYDLAGVPVSGTLSYISFWQPRIPYNAQNTCRMGRPIALAEGPSLDRDPARMEYGSMWFPLTATGAIAPLPDGAIGVMPIAEPQSNTSYAKLPGEHRDWLSAEWALIYPEADGWSWSSHLGDLPQVLLRPATDRRYRGIARGTGENGWNAAIDARTGKWVIPQDPAYPVLAAPANDPVTARANFNAVLAAQDAARARADADRNASELADYRRARDAMIAGGTFCGSNIPPARFGIAELSIFVDRCPQRISYDELVSAQKMGLSQELIDKVEAHWSRTARETAMAEARREDARRNPVPMAYTPGAFESAIRNAGNAAVADINRNSENWFDARRKAYREEWQRKQRAY